MAEQGGCGLLSGGTRATVCGFTAYIPTHRKVAMNGAPEQFGSVWDWPRKTGNS